MLSRTSVRSIPFAQTIATIGALCVLGTFWAPSVTARPGCNGKPATIVGTKQADEIVGTQEADVIVSRGGKDVVRSRGGSDTICSGAGPDRVKAGEGKDWIDGGAGNDAINGDEGRDSATGGKGIDGCITSELMKGCEANLGVEVTGPKLITNNDVDNWLFDYANKGPSAAPKTKVLITIDPRLTVETLDPACVLSPGGWYTCRLGRLDLHEDGQILLELESPNVCSDPQTDTLEVSAEIHASTEDHQPGNDTDLHQTSYQDGGC